MWRLYKIIEIQKNQYGYDVVVIDIEKNEKVKLSAISLPKHAKVGDIIRKSEHKFYDIVDENGNII
jgi:hypothetical protein